MAEKLAEKYLTEEEKSRSRRMGGLDKMMETLRKRLAEQKKRHQGGNEVDRHWRHVAYGAYGYNPEGVRIGRTRTARSVRSKSGTTRIQGTR